MSMALMRLVILQLSDARGDINEDFGGGSPVYLTLVVSDPWAAVSRGKEKWCSSRIAADGHGSRVNRRSGLTRRDAYVYLIHTPNM
nr:hypothetical protein CFP56_13452 [Quercus suber]